MSIAEPRPRDRGTNHTPIPGLPLKDELYGRATLTVPAVSARSATVTSGFGV